MKTVALFSFVAVILVSCTNAAPEVKPITDNTKIVETPTEKSKTISGTVIKSDTSFCGCAALVIIKSQSESIHVCVDKVERICSVGEPKDAQTINIAEGDKITFIGDYETRECSDGPKDIFFVNKCHTDQVMF